MSRSASFIRNYQSDGRVDSMASFSMDIDSNYENSQMDVEIGGGENSVSSSSEFNANLLIGDKQCLDEYDNQSESNYAEGSNFNFPIKEEYPTFDNNILTSKWNEFTIKKRANLLVTII
jgi:hypothetical protein